VARAGERAVSDAPPILHADMDAFYAAIEQRDHPELRGRPVVVGGSSSRGVVAAASYEARRFGIHSAMPSAQARALCPQAVFVPGDMARYARESERILEIFRSFTPAVEALSLDEAFLDLRGTERLLGSPIEVAHRLRASVRERTGLAVSVGLGPVKMVAKIASDLAKPDGILVVPASGVRDFLAPLPVGRIWGVGPVSRARLEGLGFHTVGDLARSTDAELRGKLGEAGVALARLARGEDAREVEPWREPRSYGEESTVADDVADMDRLRAAIRAHAEAVARRLRKDGYRGRGVRLKVKLARRLGGGRFPLVTRQATLAEPSDDGRAIALSACTLLGDVGLLEPVRLVGVSVHRLEPAGAEQLALEGLASETERRRRLNAALDAVRARFGVGALRIGPEPEDRAGLSLAIKRGEG
jgi:DNA polymerase-4